MMTTCCIFAKMNAQGLESYQWKNRIVVLKGNTSTKNLLQEQLQLLESQSEAFSERDVKFFVIVADKVINSSGNEVAVSSGEIIKKFSLVDFEGVVLIGKDGGVKMKEPFIVTPNELFTLIDAMPMRRSEMNGGKKID